MTVCRERFNHYLIGSQSHDEDHWEILEAIKCLVNSVCKEHALACVELVQHMWTEHSLVEEADMAKMGYPYLISHIADHQDMQPRFDTLRAKINKDTSLNVKRYCQDLEHIILTHIEKYDMQIQTFTGEVK